MSHFFRFTVVQTLPTNFQSLIYSIMLPIEAVSLFPAATILWILSFCDHLVDTLILRPCCGYSHSATILWILSFCDHLVDTLILRPCCGYSHSATILWIFSFCDHLVDTLILRPSCGNSHSAIILWILSFCDHLVDTLILRIYVEQNVPGYAQDTMRHAILQSLVNELIIAITNSAAILWVL